MSNPLPVLGTCKYGDHVFSSQVETLGFDSEPVYDAAERTVTYNRIKVRLRDTVHATPGGTTDNTLETIRRRLSAPAQTFYYDSKGWGAFSVNVGTRRDVKWGPLPRLLKFKPHGNAGAEIEWEVDLCVPEHCVNARFDNAAMSYTFRLGYQLDDGYTRIVYDAELSVAQTRMNNSRRLRFSADNWREAISPALPDGYRQDAYQFNLDESKCKATLHCEFEELPAPLPPGVLRCEASHTFRNMEDYSTAIWVSTLSANYEMDRTQSRGRALQHFKSLLDDRTRRAERYAVVPENQIGQTRGWPVLMSFEIADPDIFGRPRASFSASYFLCVGLDALLPASGLFTPVPGTSYREWRLAMTRARRAFHPRGYASHRFLAAEQDILLDLCSPDAVALSTYGSVSEERTLRSVSLRNSLPPPDRSYLQYQLNAHTEMRNDGTAVLKHLPEKPIEVQLRTGALDQGGELPRPQQGAGRLLNNTQGYQLPYKSPNESPIDIQQRVEPTVLLHLSGHAVRAGYAITPPALRKVNGVEATPLNGPGTGFTTRIVGRAAGIPIVGAAWRLTWILEKVPPGAIGVPPDLLRV